MSIISSLWGKFSQSVETFWSKNKVIIFIILLILLSLFLFKAYLSAKNDLSTFESAVEHKNDTLTLIRDQNNNLHSQLLLTQGTNTEMKIFYGKAIDSLSKVLKISSKQIDEYVQVITESKGKIRVKIDTLYKKDTVNNNGDFGFSFSSDTAYAIRFNDNWLKANLLYETGSDSVRGNYTYKDSLTVTTFYKKTGFLNLGKKVWYIDAVSKNPNTTIVGLNNFRVLDENAKKFSIGPSLSVFYDGKVRVLPSISIQYSMFKF